MITWQTDASGLAAWRMDGNNYISTLIQAIPSTDTILPYTPTPEQVKADKIAELEATVTQRRMREASLGIDGGWLKNLDDQIAALRAQGAAL